MGATGHKPPPDERSASDPRIADAARALFERSHGAVFDASAIPPKQLDDFLHCDAVLEASARFVASLERIWAERYPGEALPLREPSPVESVERYTPPDFSDTVERLRVRIEARADECSSTVQEETEEPAMPDPHREQDSDKTPSPLGSAPEAERPSAPKTAPSPSGRTEARPGAIPPKQAPPAAAPKPKVSFHLPNAKVGQAYAAAIEGRESAGRPVQILSAQVPDDLGLSFDPASGELRGTPALDGDHRIPLRWTLGDGVSYSGDCLLIVNPDPKSLWKVIEPPEDAPYPKAHVDQVLVAGEGVRIAAASRRGRSHEHAGSFRDDDFYVRHDPATGWSLMLVADGAGSAPFSREGSRIAVAAAGEHLLANLTGEEGAKLSAVLDGWDTDPDATAQSMGTDFHYLFHKAGHLAVQAIEQAAKAQGAAVRDYATTLLAAAVKRQGAGTFLATFWMGDGAIAAYGPRGKVRLMGTPDGGEFAGQTRFLDRAALSDQGFAKRIGLGRYADLSAVLLMTDGVSDPRFETDNGLGDPARWDALWDALSPLLEREAPARALAEWLAFFSPGHHDDRTIAILWPVADKEGSH